MQSTLQSVSRKSGNSIEILKNDPSFNFWKPVLGVIRLVLKGFWIQDGYGTSMEDTDVCNDTVYRKNANETVALWVMVRSMSD
jgi:hypothetical protein